MKRKIVSFQNVCGEVMVNSPLLLIVPETEMLPEPGGAGKGPSGPSGSGGDNALHDHLADPFMLAFSVLPDAV